MSIALSILRASIITNLLISLVLSGEPDSVREGIVLDGDGLSSWNP